MSLTEKKISFSFVTLFTGKLIPVAYGVKKLQIACVVEDDKVGTDFLEEKITEFEDYVSACDFGNCQPASTLPENVCLAKRYTTDSIS